MPLMRGLNVGTTASCSGDLQHRVADNRRTRVKSGAAAPLLDQIVQLLSFAGGTERMVRVCKELELQQIAERYGPICLQKLLAIGLTRSIMSPCTNDEKPQAGIDRRLVGAPERRLHIRLFEAQMLRLDMGAQRLRDPRRQQPDDLAPSETETFPSSKLQ
jgi:hypothetical protein